MNLIGDYLRQHMEATGTTVHDIVVGTNMSDSTVRNIVSEHSKSPSVYTIGTIFAFLGLSLDDFFKNVKVSNIKKTPDQKEKLMDQQSIEFMVRQSQEVLIMEQNQTIQNQTDKIDKMTIEETVMKQKINVLQRTCIGLAALSAVLVVAIVAILLLK